MSTDYFRIGCGLDVSKKQFHACVGVHTTQGDFVIRAQRKFDNTASGAKQFLAWLTKHIDKVDKARALPFQLVVESTGVYHETVVELAYEAGWKVCVELAKRVKKYLQSIGQYSKTDKLDASGICRMAVERSLRAYQPCSPRIYAIRSVLRQRQALLKQRVILNNQLHALEHSHRPDKVVRSCLLTTIKQMNQQITKLEKHLRKLYEQEEELRRRIDPIIESVKGLGWLTALTIVAETNGFDQITSRKQLASYAGYDIVENQSGQVQGRSRISKQGNARIRKVMYMAAVAAIRTKQGPIYELYLRVRKRNPKVYKKANVAVQRKLLLLFFTLYKKGEVYDPFYHRQEQKTSSSEHGPELHEIESPMATLP